MKKTVHIGFIFITLIALLTACMQEEVPAKVQTFYAEYLETLTKDSYTAVHEYCHFESSDNREMAASAPPIVSYEIISWKKLSDKLWEVKIWGVEEALPNGIYCMNYVGIIDGRYYVMGNTDEIPPELKQGVEIIPYEPSGPDVVYPDEIIGPIN